MCIRDRGNAVSGWIETESGWYYINPSDGRMSTGWQQIDGKNYYVNQEKDGTEMCIRDRIKGEVV